MDMKTVLIIDDSRTSRKMLKNILELNHFEVIGEGGDGKEGVRLFKELKPDLTTLDITMPVMDGIETLKRILEINSNAKVVMVTAAGQKGKIVEAIKLGASEFVTKPFETKQVAEILKNIDY